MTKIRKADKEDLPGILRLVRELALYERAPEEVTATIDDYQRAFTEGVFDAFVAEKDDFIIGTGVFYLTWSTWKGRMLYLEDLVVTANERRNGIGQLIFNAFLEEAHRLNCVMVKWQVLDWNTLALKFYENNAATIEKDWWNGKIIF